MQINLTLVLGCTKVLIKAHRRQSQIQQTHSKEDVHMRNIARWEPAVESVSLREMMNRPIRGQLRPAANLGG